jgi:hypothetical protein
MKSVCFYVIIGAFCMISACNQFKSDHPQSEISDPYATDLNAKNIFSYADSIDLNTLKFDHTFSLVYLLGDLSFYVEKFSSNNKTILLVEHAFNGANSKSLKKYYFKNDSLILEKVNAELANDEGTIFKDTRTFLRSNTVFKTENRTASSRATLHSLPFIDVPLSQQSTSDQSYLKSVSALNDVLNGNDKFNMVFENITTYPDSRYIILKSKVQNSYMASILVQEKDKFIDSLLNDPINFKDQKLNIKWEIKDHEAVYVARP